MPPAAPAPAGVLDSLGMFAAAAGLPEQIERAAAGARDLDGLPDHDAIENVVVLGMGGSGVAGDVLTATAGPFMPLPIVVHKGYGIPNFIDEHTLVFAVSFSGDTEELIEGATAAAAAGGRMVCLSSGGQLAELAAQWGVPHVPVRRHHPHAPRRHRRGVRAAHGRARADRPVPGGLRVDRRRHRAAAAPARPARR